MKNLNTTISATARKAMSVFQMPKRVKITGRTSSITNSFVNTLIPIVKPTEAEILRALDILGMSVESVCCAYCGDPKSEWDHLHPLVKDKRPTGFISEIGNLVPSCGKCNQSKGNKNWQSWMQGSAKQSPSSRKIKDVSERIERLKAYEAEHPIRTVNFEELMGNARWSEYWKHHEQVLNEMKKSQKLADEISTEITNRFIKS